MPEPKRRRIPKRPSPHARPARPCQWTTRDVRDLLTNPIYGYGIVLEPADQVPVAVQRFERQLADEQNQRGFGFTLQELDQRFQSFFSA